MGEAEKETSAKEDDARAHEPADEPREEAEKEDSAEKEPKAETKDAEETPHLYPEHAYQPLLAASIAAAVTEGAQAGTEMIREHAGIGQVSFAAWETFSAVLLPSILASLVLGMLFDRRVVKTFAHDLLRALTGGDPKAHEGLSGALGVAVFAAAIGISTAAGRNLAVISSPNTAITITTVLEVLIILLAAPLAVLLGRFFGPHLRTLEDRFPRIQFLTTGMGGLVTCGTIVVIAVSGLVPAPFLATISAGVYGIALGVSDQTRVWLAERLHGKRGIIFVAALLMGTGIAPMELSQGSAAARRVVVYRAPIAGSLIVGVRSMVDQDHDGYSPILLGGDCDDHDPNINPGARDIPGDGIDQNCSGADAKPYVPFAQPRFVTPSTLPHRPNIVLLQMDAERPDHLGFAGYARTNISPQTDAFRKTATWFKRTYSPAPSTRFAMAAMFTGQDVDRIPQRRLRVNDFEMLPSTTTIASRLGQINYDRVGYTISYVLDHIKGVGLGFRVWETPWPEAQWKENYPVTATKTTDAGISYLKTMPADGSKPYMLFLHYMCTHDPYAKNDRWDYGGSPMDAYDSGLSYCDDEVGRFLRDLDSRPDKENTVVILFSDHGELFGEHGFTFHGNTVFEPEARALLLVRIPGLKGPDTVSSAVSLMDLYPTILQLAGASPDLSSEAWNLIPFMVEGDKAASAARPLFLYSAITVNTVHHETRGIVVDHMKYIDDITSGIREMFDVTADPAELNDLSDSAPKKRAQLAEQLEAWERGVGQFQQEKK